MKSPRLFLIILFYFITNSLIGQNIVPSGPLILCPNSSITLTVQDAQAGTTFQWQRNGNDVKDSIRSSFVVTEEGDYSVEITRNGDKNDLNTVIIRAGSAPTADFNFNPTSTCGVSTISFNNNSSGAVRYIWDFGNGKSSDDENPKQKYRPSAGNSSDTYQVTLTAIGPNGCSSSSTKSLTIGQRPDATLSGNELTQINGEPYFKICQSVAYSFTINNASSTADSNTRYEIDWGDGSPKFNSNTFGGPLTHLYGVGQKNLIYKVYRGQCVDSAIYRVFVGNIPAGGIAGIGGSTICTGNAQQFKIENSGSNPDGTLYVINYSESTLNDTFFHPAPDTLSHIFNRSSCGVSSSNGIRNFPNSFGAYLTITNPCGEAGGSILPIYVSDKPKAEFQITPGDSVCVNQTVRIQNTKVLQNSVENGNCVPGKFIWNIESSDGATSWVLAAGSSNGTKNGNENPVAWTSGSGVLNLSFTKTGVYKISLITKNNNNCGADTMVKTICVNPAPTASFTTDVNEGCGPLKVKATGTTNQASCGNNKFVWSVSYLPIDSCAPKIANYQLLNGTTQNSAAPEFEFINPGKYTLRLQVLAPGGNCVSNIVEQIITVKGAPVVTVPNIPNFCQDKSIAPVLTATCYTDALTTYSWNFPDGSPSNSTAKIPGNIFFSTAGLKTITASATNSCGTGTASINVTVLPLPVVDVIEGPNEVCVASTIKLSNKTLNGVWSSSNPLIASIDANGNVRGIDSGSVIIRYTVTSGGCSRVVTKTLNINPIPKLTVPARQDICIGKSIDIAISGNADTYSWSPATGLNTISGTTVTASPAISQTYTITASFTATGCVKRDSVRVNVNQQPRLQVNSPTICAGQSVSLVASGAVSYLWSPSTGLTTTTGAQVSATPTATSVYTVIGTSGIGCSDTAEATVTVNPRPVVTVNNGTICAGSSITLSGQGADTYSWSIPGNAAITGASVIVSPLVTSTIRVTGTSDATKCSSTADALVTVNPLPNVTVNSPIICPGDSAILIVAGADDFSWSPSTSLNITSGNTVVAKPTGTTTYTVRGTNSQTSCFKEVNAVVTVRAIPTIQAVSVNPTSCNSTTGIIRITGLVPNTSYTARYTSFGTEKSVTGNASAAGIFTISGLPSGTYTNIYIAQFNCTSNAIASIELVNPDPPALPVLASVDPICSGAALNLSITNTTANTSYLWTGPNGFTRTTTTGSVSIPNVQVSGAGEYAVVAVQNACNSSSATVTVTVNQTPPAPSADSLTFCQLEKTSELTADVTAPNQALWYTVAQGGTPSTIAPTPSTTQIGSTIYYVSQKSPENCESPRVPIVVLVNTTPNIGPQSLEICSDIPFKFRPVGASTSTSYTWGLPLMETAGALTGATQQDLPVQTIDQTLSNTTLNAATAVYKVANSVGTCAGPDFELTVKVNPTPVILNKTLEPICSGETFTFTPTQNTPGERLPIGTRLSWTVASISPANSIVGASGSTIPQLSLIQTLTNQTNQVATVTYNVIPYFNDCAGQPFTVVIQVKPRPKISNLKETICSEQTLSPLIQNLPPNTILPEGTLFSWNTPQVVGNDPSVISGYTSQVSGVPTFSQTLVNNTSSPQTLIYTISTIAGSCEGPNFTVEVLVNPKPNLNSYSDTICSGTAFRLPISAAPVGTTFTWGLPVVVGAGNVNGIGAQAVPVSTVSQLLSSDQAVPVKVLYNIVPTSGSCGGSGFPLEVIINPTPFLPTLRDTICTGEVFEVVPSGSESNAVLPDNTKYTWTTPISLLPGQVTGGTDQSVLQTGISQQLFNSGDAPANLRYSITPLSGSFGNCLGKPFDLIVTVNPNARAVLNPIDTIGCAPFVIDPAKVRLQSKTLANATYDWYVDGTFVGTNNLFPGFTMQSPDDTLYLKLVTTSLYGCKPDSAFSTFYTFKVPNPEFTISDSVGCGPLDITINNNTPFKELFTYNWSFGNGLTSFQPEPSVVRYLPNPSFGDTTYRLRLNVTSVCGVYSIEKQIRVKSKPKALFTPSSTLGCSPMKVIFNNTSKGLNNYYKWDFGDGTIDSTNAAGFIEHTFITSVRDTFTVKLFAINECGVDSTNYQIIVSPNSIKLDFAVNGTQKEGCVSHRVDFINNTSGASLFRWDFGDGNVRSTVKNIDTVSHTYLQPGTYNVRLFATNGCSDTTASEQIIVYGLPTAEFFISRNDACIGDSVFLLNKSIDADTYLWKFGDGRTTSAVNPGHRYAQSGEKKITLIAYKTNAPGIVCVDSIVRTVRIIDSVNINFSYSDSIANCAPLTVVFKNLYPGNFLASWDFGDGRKTTGDSVTNIYKAPGTYNVLLNVKTNNGCNLYGTKPVVIRSPFGTVRYKSGYSCIEESIRFEALADNTDSIRWNFGDGTTYTTKERVAFHSYKLPGVYLPKVEFFSGNGCVYLPILKDSIRIDKVSAGFRSVSEELCGSTKVIFTDTSNSYFPLRTIRWNFGDGTSGNSFIQTINYQATNRYTVTNIVTGVSGCSDTAFSVLPVFVKGIPSIQILGDTIGCTNKPISFQSTVSSSDSIILMKWRISDNSDVYGPAYSTQYGSAGSYPLLFVAGTRYGCYDTVRIPLSVYATPNVVASSDVTVCKGSSIELSATGADRYSWFPVQDISCINCARTLAKPQQNTIFTVRGETLKGCYDLDTVLVTVVPDFKIQVSGSDSICIGESVQLLASGARFYKWTPSETLSSDTIQNPIAKPDRTTTYRVVGSDEYGCFKDTGFVTIGVGRYPVVNLGEDQLFPTGTLFTLRPSFTEGPIKTWSWTPAKDLSCADCPAPTVRVRNAITYVAKATNYFGCTGSDTVSIKVFCENSQVFIPNAFTPDSDGINDQFIIRASGIQTIKSLRIYNRWGKLIFDRANFEPNDPKFAWDGRINGVIGGPDVFVYTVEVICDDGTPYFYKGNLSLLK